MIKNGYDPGPSKKKKGKSKNTKKKTNSTSKKVAAATTSSKTSKSAKGKKVNSKAKLKSKSSRGRELGLSAITTTAPNVQGSSHLINFNGMPNPTSKDNVIDIPMPSPATTAHILNQPNSFTNDIDPGFYNLLHSPQLSLGDSASSKQRMNIFSPSAAMPIPRTSHAPTSLSRLALLH